VGFFWIGNFRAMYDGSPTPHGRSGRAAHSGYASPHRFHSRRYDRSPAAGFWLDHGSENWPQMGCLCSGAQSRFMTLNGFLPRACSPDRRPSGASPARRRMQGPMPFPWPHNQGRVDRASRETSLITRQNSNRDWRRMAGNPEPREVPRAAASIGGGPWRRKLFEAELFFFIAIIGGFRLQRKLAAVSGKRGQGKEIDARAKALSGPGRWSTSIPIYDGSGHTGARQSRHRRKENGSHVSGVMAIGGVGFGALLAVVRSQGGPRFNDGKASRDIPPRGPVLSAPDWPWAWEQAFRDYMDGVRKNANFDMETSRAKLRTGPPLARLCAGGRARARPRSGDRRRIIRAAMSADGGRCRGAGALGF